MPRSFVLVANPANRRVAFFQAALGRAGLPPARVVPWIDVARGAADLASVLEPGAIVRFDSPGEDDAVERAFVELGASGATASWQEGAAEHGRIRSPRLWYRGFCAALKRCEADLSRAPEHVLLNAPRDIAVMFDKRLCHARLAGAGVPVPPALGAREGIHDWSMLRAKMKEARMPRVFVKLAHGSSASGVVALETRGDELLAHTTCEMVRDANTAQSRFYNRLRVMRLTREQDIAPLVNFLCAEGAHVERWLPKAGIDGRTFDLRVLVIDGVARQIVVRTSRGSITNLHLGNQRGEVARVRERMGEASFQVALAAAEAALGAFPTTRYAGVDLMIDSSFKRPAVLEVNAFGDLLPNAFHEGQDSYGTEIAAATGYRLAPAPITSPLGPDIALSTAVSA